MKKRMILLLCLLLTLCACSPAVSGDEQGILLYFLQDPQDGQPSHGPALVGQPYSGAEDPTPGDLIHALLQGPTQEGLRSPYPKGVFCRWWHWDDEQPGKLRVGVSGQYDGLTDIALTLADYSLVLTLCQLPEVECVEIVSQGGNQLYRSHQLLSGQEAVLFDEVIAPDS